MRFKTSRELAPYLGLVPRQRESGDYSPELRITKTGDLYLRQLLINGAHYIIGYRGPDSDLRRLGGLLRQGRQEEGGSWCCSSFGYSGPSPVGNWRGLRASPLWGGGSLAAVSGAVYKGGQRTMAQGLRRTRYTDCSTQQAPDRVRSLKSADGSGAHTMRGHHVWP